MDAFVFDQPGGRVSPRPDRRVIKRAVEDRLRRSGYLALTDVSCDVRDGVVCLRGHLPSYELEQVAQALAAEVEGGRHLVNRIEVTAPAPRPPVGYDRATNPRDGAN